MNCNICFEYFNISNRKPMTIYGCGHTFCLACLDLLAEKNCNYIVLGIKRSALLICLNQKK